jgi:hypothetical protein
MGGTFWPPEETITFCATAMMLSASREFGDLARAAEWGNQHRCVGL